MSNFCRCTPAGGMRGWAAPGLTDIDSGSNPAPTVLAQAGYGPANTAPAANPNWTWLNAAPNPLYSGLTDDEYVATLAIPAAGSYHALFRFSGDGGQTWLYGGSSGPPSANGTVPFPDAVPVTVSP